MIRTYTELGALVSHWNHMALASGSLFATHEWLSCWWRAFGRGQPNWKILHDTDGSILAGAFLRPLWRNGVASGANVHSGTWDVLARDDASRARLWSSILESGANRVHLEGLPLGGASEQLARAQLQRLGYRVVATPGPFSPWMRLPDSWEELERSLRSSMRSQIKRTRRRLAERGDLVFRTVLGGPELERELTRFFALEASGWKGRNKSAIAQQPSTERLYRSFGSAAAERGWLRLNLLELDGELIAASYDCAFGDGASFIKTTFDERLQRLSPGSCLLANVIRSAIDERLSWCDFLGEADLYKTRWTSEVRPRVALWAYRGEALPGYTLRGRVRPVLKSVDGRIGVIGRRARTLRRV